MNIIKTFSDGSFLEYDRGKFDDWCVYYTDVNGTRKPPKDIDYFATLKDLARQYGENKVYLDYVSVYERTGREVTNSVLEYITSLAQTYDENQRLQIDVLYSILYMAMVAEERKAYTKLGKRIKRIGIHMLLLENRSVAEAANFMRGMGWRDIDTLCRQRKF